MTSPGQFFDSQVVRFSSFLPRRLFWDLRARGIDSRWGTGREDYAVLRKVISEVQPTSVLDIGCGTGRLFPLFEEYRIQNVVGQDVSRWALSQANKRYPGVAKKLLNIEIIKLVYPSRFFDLCISNRVLSAIPPNKLDQVINRIASFSRYIYLNEFGPTDEGQPSSYWFRHDYDVALKKCCNFREILKGTIGHQTYRLLDLLPLNTQLGS